MLKYKKEQVVVLGCPIVFKEEENNFRYTDYYLYISSGLREAGVINITDEEEKRFLLEIYKAIKQIGEKIVIKLHPSEDIKKYESYFSAEKNVILVKDINLKHVVRNSKLVIGDYSTALYYAIFLKKPIIILPNPFMEFLPYDFTKFGIGKKISINNFADQIQNFNMVINTEAYQSFIAEMSLDRINNVYVEFYNVLEDLFYNKKKIFD